MQKYFLSSVAYVATSLAMYSPSANAQPSQSYTPSSYPNKWALVIGVDKFLTKSWNYKYGVKDAQDFQNYLINTAHFQPDHVKLVTGPQATKDTVLNECRSWLRNSVKQGDLLVIYVRSRGVDLTNMTSFSGSQESRLMALSDTKEKDAQETGLKINDLPELFCKELPKGPVAMILDVDFAGTLRWITMQNFSDEGDTRLGNPLVLVSSTQNNQISWQSYTAKNSVFTRELIDELTKMGGDADLTVAVDAIGPKVKQRVYEQRGRSQEPLSMASSGPNSYHHVNLAAPTPQSKAASADEEDETPLLADVAPKGSEVSTSRSGDASFLEIKEILTKANVGDPSLLTEGRVLEHDGSVAAIRKSSATDDDCKLYSLNCAKAIMNAYRKVNIVTVLLFDCQKHQTNRIEIHKGHVAKFGSRDLNIGRLLQKINLSILPLFPDYGRPLLGDYQLIRTNYQEVVIVRLRPHNGLSCGALYGNVQKLAIKAPYVTGFTVPLEGDNNPNWKIGYFLLNTQNHELKSGLTEQGWRECLKQVDWTTPTLSQPPMFICDPL